jgi:hypothetical protein
MPLATLPEDVLARVVRAAVSDDGPMRTLLAAAATCRALRAAAAHVTILEVTVTVDAGTPGARRRVFCSILERRAPKNDPVVRMLRTHEANLRARREPQPHELYHLRYAARGPTVEDRDTDEWEAEALDATSLWAGPEWEWTDEFIIFKEFDFRYRPSGHYEPSLQHSYPYHVADATNRMTFRTRLFRGGRLEVDGAPPALAWAVSRLPVDGDEYTDIGPECDVYDMSSPVFTADEVHSLHKDRVPHGAVWHFDLVLVQQWGPLRVALRIDLDQEWNHDPTPSWALTPAERTVREFRGAEGVTYALRNYHDEGAYDEFDAAPGVAYPPGLNIARASLGIRGMWVAESLRW